MADAEAAYPGVDYMSRTDSGHDLGRQLHAQRREDSGDGLEPRIGVAAQRLVERLSGEACGLGDLGHASRLSSWLRRGRWALDVSVHDIRVPGMPTVVRVPFGPNVT
jgi:hypothetical protein